MTQYRQSILLTVLSAVLLTAAGFAGAQTGGSVRGRVVHAVTLEPVEGAIVVLQGMEPDRESSRIHSYIAKTNSSGEFRITGIIPGRYQARPEREGFAARFAGIAETARTSPPVVIRPAGALDSLVLKLIPTGAISGRVYDVNGAPVLNARVQAFRYTYPNGEKKMTPVSSASADDRGVYRLFGLMPGNYFVGASDCGCTTSWTSAMQVRGAKPVTEFQLTYFPAATNVSAAVSVRVAPDADLREINIQAQPLRHVTLRIKVEGPPGVSSTAALGIGSPGGGIISTKVAYGEVFVNPNAVPGRYFIDARDDRLALHTQRLLDLADRDLEVTLSLGKALTLAGTLATEDGRLGTGEPPRVTFQPEISAISAVTVATEPDGGFAVAGLQPVRYRIAVTCPAAFCYTKSIRVGGEESMEPFIDMARARGPISVAIGVGGGILKGVVVDSDGVPSEGAVVVVASVGTKREWREYTKSATTDATGGFELRDIPPGEYRAYAWDDAEPGAPLDADFRKPFEGRAVMVAIERGRTESVRLRPLSDEGPK